MTTNSLNNENQADFTVGNGSSGSLRKIRVENDNNTASSQAYLENYVAGTSADDPYTSCIVGTTVSHAIGIDNSDSQSLKLGYAASASATPSSTAFFNIKTDANVFFDYQPCFRVTWSSTQSNATGDGTVFYIPFNSEDYDVGSNFNSGTGIFTAPIDGTYLFTMQVFIADLDNTHDDAWFKIYVNGTDSVVFRTKAYNIAYGISWRIMYKSIYMIKDLSASDTVRASTIVDGGTKTVDINPDSDERTNFTGYLIA